MGMRRALAAVAVAATTLAAVVVPVAVSATASELPVAGISFVGPVTTLDTRSAAEIFPGGLYLDTQTDAAAAVARLQRAGDTASAALLRRISDQPTAVWLGEWYSEAQLRTTIARHLATARTQGRTPVFVTYAIPNRDCGGYSAGGLTPAAYLDWNRSVAAALAGSSAVVIVEPDALAMLTGDRCPGERDRRLSTMRGAVDILAGAGLSLYLDAGHSNWTGVDEMRDLLQAAGIDEARGFATNVSNYRTVADERVYGDRLSYALGGKHYVVDVSRNGAGWQGDWCNPGGAAIGRSPSVSTAVGALDALLWIKHPGQSDGTCNGGPPAGQWWDTGALALARDR